MRPTTAPALAAAALLAGTTAFAAGAVAGEPAKLATDSKHPYGKYLVDGEKRSLYMFKGDTQGIGESSCQDACADAWPPLTTSGQPKVGGGLDDSYVGTIKRGEGRRQVTFMGWPLYYYAEDQKPGDTKGQDVHGFGGEWYLVGQDGEPIDDESEEQESTGKTEKNGQKG